MYILALKNNIAITSLMFRGVYSAWLQGGGGGGICGEGENMNKFKSSENIFPVCPFLA